MYLPTFWKLCQENRGVANRHLVPWVLPITFFGKS